VPAEPVQPILFGDFDANGDGVNDFITAMPPDSRHLLAHAVIQSGANDAVLLDMNAAQPEDIFGMTVARGAGDVNRDGYDDFLINTMRPDVINPDAEHTYVSVYSGFDGSVLYTLHSDTEFDAFGVMAAPAGDVNADGYADIIVGAPLHTAGGMTMSGRAMVFSGLDGSVIYDLAGMVANMRFGASVTGVGDIDADGRADFAIGAPGISNSAEGVVVVYSGATGIAIRTYTGAPGARFGETVCAIDDQNGDGVADIAIAAPRASAGFDRGMAQTLKGNVFLYSLADGAVLATLKGAPGMYYGMSVRGTRWDWDGDGIGDLVIGEADQATPTDLALARVYFVSTATGNVLGDVLLGDLVASAPLKSPDVTRDGVVNSADIEYILANFGEAVTDGAADPNGDGFIGVSDLEQTLGVIAMGGVPDGASPALGLIPMGSCRNNAIAIITGAVIAYGGCVVASFFAPVFGVLCFDYLNTNILGPAILGIVGSCVAG